jgi:thiopurine S-methyltransferase
MKTDFLNEAYWQHRYLTAATGWDAGGITTPLKEYFDQLTDKNLRILIPGGGNSYEAEYLHRAGFSNVTVLDIAPAPLENLKRRLPSFPAKHLIQGDFFNHTGQYDLIVEQTFFCALDPSMRPRYAEKMYELLAASGKLAGLLFDDPLADVTPPPFGGSAKEYAGYFNPFFEFRVFEKAHNSIPPRRGAELFVILVKKQ